ncbi:MAG: hypothetical protein HFH67_09755 [Lachnospiraceae bacterium]|nr:hypothetical protein [Lachnospiraceae bacterium]
MLGQIALAVLSAACMTDQNDATREASSNQVAIQRERAEADIAIEKEKTKQQIIGGIFEFLNSYTKDKGQV